MGTGLSQSTHDAGIIPRAINSLYNLLNDKNSDYAIHVSFLELYNEELIDLLNPRPKSASSQSSIREDSNGNIIWVGVAEELVHSKDDLFGFLQKGSLCRSTGSTDMNASSSRSHAIFSIILRQRDTLDDGTLRTLTSKFHFVDLAGSERLKRTNALGDRKREGISINQGLLSLGNVISALSDSHSHIPYRDSKLTRLLQDSLGGNSNTFMLACISADQDSYGETCNTLMYANRARNIRNKAVMNQVIGGDKEVSILRGLVQELRREIEIMKQSCTCGNTTTPILNTQLDYMEKEDSELKKRVELLEFECERYKFMYSQISKKNASCNDLLLNVVCERDAALLNLGKLKAGNENIQASNEPLSKTMIENYNKTIAQLRIKLSESNDQLEWYHQVVSEFEDCRDTSTVPAIPRPLPRSVTNLISEDADTSEFSSENRFTRALETIPDFGKVLSSASPVNKVKDDCVEYFNIFGVPKTLTHPSKPSRLVYESLEKEDTDDEYTSHDDEKPDMEKPIPPKTDKSSEMYMLIHRLQSDISSHQSIVDKLKQREIQHEAMRQAYESKLQVLNTQLNQVARERDEALTKSRKLGRGASANVRRKFDDQKRKLEVEIGEYKRKMLDGAKITCKTQNDGVTRQLLSTIEALKAEKAKIMRDLKKEAMKHKDLKNAKEREIARLLKKEKAVKDVAKKLERIILKRRSDEVVLSHTKLKSVMFALKKVAPAGSLETIAKLQNLGQSQASLAGIRKKGTPLKDILALRNFTPDLSLDIGRESKIPPIAVRSKFKKQMIAKELESAISYRLSELNFNVLSAERDRLLGEQKELLKERERCVAAEAERTGFWDSQTPQYMDDRLNAIEMEVAMLNARLKNMQVDKQTTDIHPDSEDIPDSNPLSINMGDLGWENAVNLVRGLDSIEMEYVSVLLLDDILNLEVNKRSYETKLTDCEKSVEELKSALHTMRGAALQTAMEYRKEMENLRKQAENTRAVNIHKELIPGTATPKLQRMFDNAYGPGVVVIKPLFENSTETRKESQQIEKHEDIDHAEKNDEIENAENRREGLASISNETLCDAPKIVVEDYENVENAPKNMKDTSTDEKLAPEDFSKSQMRLRSHSLAVRNCLANLDDHEDPALENTSCSEQEARRPLTAPMLTTRSISTDSPIKEKKFFSGSSGPSALVQRLTNLLAKQAASNETQKKKSRVVEGAILDSDVFSRLSQSHTQASQAKVIHREKDEKKEECI